MTEIRMGRYLPYMEWEPPLTTDEVARVTQIAALSWEQCVEQAVNLFRLRMKIHGRMSEADRTFLKFWQNPDPSEEEILMAPLSYLLARPVPTPPAGRAAPAARKSPGRRGRIPGR